MTYPPTHLTRRQWVPSHATDVRKTMNRHRPLWRLVAAEKRAQRKAR